MGDEGEISSVLSCVIIYRLSAGDVVLWLRHAGFH